MTHPVPFFPLFASWRLKFPLLNLEYQGNITSKNNIKFELNHFIFLDKIIGTNFGALKGNYCLEFAL